MASPAVSPKRAIAGLTGLQKAAITLVALGSKASASVLKLLPEDDVSALTAAIARLDMVTSEQIEGVLEEFSHSLSSQGFATNTGIDYARNVLVEAFGSDLGTRLVDRLVRSLDEDESEFEGFGKIDPQQLAKFLQDEHPQAIALVLSHLDPSEAATLLTSLPAEIRSDVATRMAGLEQISPESVRTIAAVIRQKLRNLGELTREACGGVKAVASVLNRLPPNSCSQLLDEIEVSNPDLFESIRRLMFVFEDLLTLDPMGVKELLARVDRKLVTLALKGTSEELRQHFFKGFSQRGAEMLKEDLAAMGPVKLKDVDAAQQQIIATAREMEKEGVISLKGSPADRYVT